MEPEIRRIKESELHQAAALANIVFCNDENGHMGYCFPTLFQAGISHSYGAFTSDGKLISFMGMVPVRINAKKLTLKAFSIGAVCTDPAFRGHGIASKLLERCHQHARYAGASVLFISGDRSLYTRAGSVFYGKAHKITIEAMSENVEAPSNDASIISPWEYSNFVPHDIFALHHLLTTKLSSIEWGISELQQSIGIAAYATLHKQHQHIRVAHTKDHEMVAALILMIPDEDSTKPERQGLIMEWAGDPLAAKALIYDAISHYQLTSLSGYFPWQDSKLIDLLQQDNVTSEIQKNAGTILIVDGETLLQQTGLDMIDSDILFEENNQQLCSLVFDPDSNEHTVPLPYMYGLYFV